MWMPVCCGTHSQAHDQKSDCQWVKKGYGAHMRRTGPSLWTMCGCGPLDDPWSCPRPALSTRAQVRTYA